MHFAWNVVCDSDDRVEMVIESIFYFIMKSHVSLLNGKVMKYVGSKMNFIFIQSIYEISVQAL